MEDPRNKKSNFHRWSVDKVRYHLDKEPAPHREIRAIADVLQSVLDDFEQPVQENVLLLREAWPELVGSQIAQHSQPGFIKDFSLHIFVDHPGWLPELERMKRPLLLKLQSSYRELNIRKLRFSLEHR